MYQPGEKHRPLLVAEIGINHEGSLSRAKEIVEEFHKVGVKAFKTQIHCFLDEYHPSARSLNPPNASRNIIEVISSNALSAADEEQLHDYICGKGALYIATAFSRRGVEFLDALDVGVRKIGSGEIGNLLLLKRAIQNATEVIASTGLHAPEVLYQAAAVLRERDLPTTLLACTNLYPTLPRQANLVGMDILRAEYPDFKIGFSDHTQGIELSLAAIARGGTVVERHICLDDSQGPDIAASLTPPEFQALIQGSDKIFDALNSPERANVASVELFAHSSLVADRDLEEGHTISEADLWAMRPGTGDFRGWQSQNVLGKRLKRGISAGEFIMRADLEESSL